jgi:F-type H+-transporting ATPase subunit a
MAETGVEYPELPNLISLLAEKFAGNHAIGFLKQYENIVFSLITVSIISLVAYIAGRRKAMVPGRLQAAVEGIVGGMDAFVCGILGPHGRKLTPFIGTIFIYILFMNLASFVPFMKAPTSSWSTTLALALCVFIHLQYTALRELGFLGYIDHLLGKPRGILAFSVVIPLLMLFLHTLAELIRPISLSLRLRSNIWGDDMLLAVLAGFGPKGLPLLLFNMVLAILAAVVQACVFSLLTTIYFALVLTHED